MGPFQNIWNLSSYLSFQVVVLFFALTTPAIFMAVFVYHEKKEAKKTRENVRKQFIKMCREGERRREAERIKKET